MALTISALNKINKPLLVQVTAYLLEQVVNLISFFLD